MKAQLVTQWQALQPQLRRSIHGLNPEDRDDVLQTAFEFLWTTLRDDWTPLAGQTVEAGLSHIIYAAVWYARLTCLLGKKRAAARTVSMEDYDVSNVAGDDPFTLLERSEETENTEEHRQRFMTILRLALLYQKPRVQRVFDLVYYQGVPQAVVAATLGVPRSTIRSMIRVGRQRIREWLGEHNLDGGHHDRLEGADTT
jgi:RNA polymerase sigma factor (sigma-70 family)